MRSRGQWPHLVGVPAPSAQVPPVAEPVEECAPAGHPHALTRAQFEIYASRNGRERLPAGATIHPCEGHCHLSEDNPCFGWHVVRP